MTAPQKMLQYPQRTRQASLVYKFHFVIGMLIIGGWFFFYDKEKVYQTVYDVP